MKLARRAFLAGGATAIVAPVVLVASPAAAFMDVLRRQVEGAKREFAAAEKRALRAVRPGDFVFRQGDYA
jgi:hypothetical protein